MWLKNGAENLSVLDISEDNTQLYVEKTKMIRMIPVILPQII